MFYLLFVFGFLVCVVLMLVMFVMTPYSWENWKVVVHAKYRKQQASMLLTLTQVLYDAKILYWPINDTLLDFVRDGKLSDKRARVEFAFLADDAHRLLALESRLCDNTANYFRIKKYSDCYRFEINTIFNFPFVAFYPMQKYKHEMRMCVPTDDGLECKLDAYAHCDRRLVFLSSDIFPLTLLDDNQWPMPAKPNNCLRQLFGDDFHKRNPSIDFLKNECARQFLYNVIHAVL